VIGRVPSAFKREIDRGQKGQHPILEASSARQDDSVPPTLGPAPGATLSPDQLPPSRRPLCVVVESDDLIHARMKAAISGDDQGLDLDGAHQPDLESARQIPDGMVGRSLVGSASEDCEASRKGMTRSDEPIQPMTLRNMRQNGVYGLRPLFTTLNDRR
jgi:hypothetical protein